MTVSALQAGAYLHHLRISSPEPERLAAFYARAMDMSATQSADGSWVVRGPGRRLEVIVGPAKALVHAGFAVRDA